MTMTMAAVAVAPNDWVVCFGEARPVTDGRVFCPAVGGTIRESCAECRMLGWQTDERERSSRCSTERQIDR